MGRKVKYTKEQKIKASEDYIGGIKSAIKISEELGMGCSGRNEVRLWAKKYVQYGSSAFEERKENNSYSKEFKDKMIKEYLSGKGSIIDLALKYKLPSKETLRQWIKKYNSHIELKDYDPKPEVYMADTLKTTFDERIEIVKYCLEHNRNIKETAAHFGCNYAQLYQWVRKYEKLGEEGLADKRGKRKKEEELDDIEKANRRIKQLEREKEELERKYELLKKAEERERWW